MILVRHVRGDDFHRTVLLGRLERDDAQAVAAIGRNLPTATTEVRVLLSKLWPGEPAATEALADLVTHLNDRGVGRSWVGAVPEVAAALIDFGEGANLVDPGPDDVRAAAAWTGTPPLSR